MGRTVGHKWDTDMEHGLWDAYGISEYRTEYRLHDTDSIIRGQDREHRPQLSTRLHFVTVLVVQDMHWHSWTLVHAMYVRSMYATETMECSRNIHTNSFIHRAYVTQY